VKPLPYTLSSPEEVRLVGLPWGNDAKKGKGLAVLPRLVSLGEELFYDTVRVYGDRAYRHFGGRRARANRNPPIDALVAKG
jgi:uncharacterized protein YktB (UPF0637 family)